MKSNNKNHPAVALLRRKLTIQPQNREVHTQLTTIRTKVIQCLAPTTRQIQPAPIVTQSPPKSAYVDTISTDPIQALTDSKYSRLPTYESAGKNRSKTLFRCKSAVIHSSRNRPGSPMSARGARAEVLFTTVRHMMHSARKHKMHENLGLRVQGYRI